MMLRPVEGSTPKSGSDAISEKSSFHQSCERLMLRKPFTTLKPLISGTLEVSQSPMAFPVASGDEWDILSSGNTTNV